MNSVAIKEDIKWEIDFREFTLSKLRPFIETYETSGTLFYLEFGKVDALKANYLYKGKNIGDASEELKEAVKEIIQNKFSSRKSKHRGEGEWQFYLGEA